MCQVRSVDEDNCKRKNGFEAAIGDIQAGGRIVPDPVIRVRCQHLPMLT